ncbi:PepSY domain-containing protein [Moraxella sp. FZLJ2107]|uniref:PepSY domain-containing protein n=1 Tax=unclassified Moraxella TaxID=2685852 RepID=UPI0020C91E53|nr:MULTISPECIES: PepSY domain-containing protein [unclassified Moraxella]UTO04371.1 PepSY domain-containing protein [Moraxella sp. FZLJ2107]UTO23204.1 PepSY domain-containing protein [Moraxella sp. FZLJ2109]
MKHIKTLAIACATLIASTSALASATCPSYPAKEHIPQKALEQALINKGFTVKNFKVSGNCYELYGKSPKGKKVEMYFDMKTGKIVKSEIE